MKTRNAKAMQRLRDERRKKGFVMLAGTWVHRDDATRAKEYIRRLNDQRGGLPDVKPD